MPPAEIKQAVFICPYHAIASPYNAAYMGIVYRYQIDRIKPIQSTAELYRAMQHTRKQSQNTRRKSPLAF